LVLFPMHAVFISTVYAQHDLARNTNIQRSF
jgi:hypothetical protein